MHNGWEEHVNSKRTLQRDERPHIDRMYVHTHKVLGMDDRERGRQTRVAGKVNVIERVGYTVYVGSERGRGVCLLTTRNKCPGL
jgi:hypothetical protein